MLGKRAYGLVLGIFFALNALSAAPVCAVDAPLPEGRKTITLIATGGERLSIGTITFARAADTATFTLALDGKAFQDEFLSMRPFSCIPGEKQMWCHLAYPYDLKRMITTDDLADLEYSLLFLFKPPAGYGIDPWNGLYFKLALASDGAITGRVHDVNLDPLGVPPADKSARTILPSDLTPSDPASRRFSRIEIR